MANILLISYFFPPHNSIPCRRAYAWAKYLAKYGNRVTVLTAKIPGDEITQSFNVDLSAFDVIRLKYFDVVHLVTRFLKPKTILSNDSRAIWQTKIFYKYVEKIMMFCIKYLCIKGVFLGGTRFPTFFELWFLKAYKKAIDIIKNKNINIIITTSPPPTVNVVGLCLKKKYNKLIWISDYRDLWVDNPAHKGLFPFDVIENIYEKKCIKKSDRLIVVSEAMRKYFENKYPDKKSKIFVIENGYDVDLLQRAKQDSVMVVDKKKTIVYAGTLYEYRRNPDVLFKTVRKRKLDFKEALEIIFYGNHETKRILNNLFVRYKECEGIIKYDGFISSEEILRKEYNADILLFIEDDRNNDGVFTGKIFEYMMLNKPILCIGVTPDSYVGAMLKKTGLCIFCKNDMEEIEKSLYDIINNKIAISPNKDFIEGFSRDRQVGCLNDIIKNCLSKDKDEKR